ncbi:hypothetical protein TIFTF001_034142 [Ficus carica]|uniref:Uncharacterized protein n=1 Tax=Ficus carica TaxID=3494 RepID=A0AA88J8S4_FICCA|nr:hypothetical protein TIFTF001_034142 [Ficus carica]
MVDPNNKNQLAVLRRGIHFFFSNGNWNRNRRRLHTSPKVVIITQAPSNTSRIKTRATSSLKIDTPLNKFWKMVPVPRLEPIPIIQINSTGGIERGPEGNNFVEDDLFRTNRLWWYKRGTHFQGCIEQKPSNCGSREPKSGFMIRIGVEIWNRGWGRVSKSGSGLGFKTGIEFGFRDVVGVGFLDESRGQVSRQGSRSGFEGFVSRPGSRLGFETAVGVGFQYCGRGRVSRQGSRSSFKMGVGRGRVLGQGSGFGFEVGVGVGFRDWDWVSVWWSRSGFGMGFMVRF